MSRSAKLLEQSDTYYFLKFGKSPEEVKREKVKTLISNNQVRVETLMDTVSNCLKSMDAVKLKNSLKDLSGICDSLLGELGRMK